MAAARAKRRHVLAPALALLASFAHSHADQHCIDQAIKEWPAYGYLDDKEMTRVNQANPKLCATLNDMENEERQQFLWTVQAWVLRIALCDNGKLQAAHVTSAEQPYTELATQGNQYRAAFCEMAQATEQLSIAYDRFLESKDRHLKNAFCTIAENIGKPGIDGVGQIIGLAMGTFDAPSLVELRTKAKELCIALKLGKIDFREAWVRLETEERFAAPAIAKESTEIIRETIWDWLSWPFVLLASALGVVATVVGIVTALKKWL